MVKDFKSLLNDFTKPILFVALVMLFLAIFGENIMAMDYVSQFIVIGLPLSLVVFYYFGKIKDGWRYVIALLLVSFSWDLIMPPYAVNSFGEINHTIFMAGASVDYFIANSLYFAGFNGFVLYLLTYVGGFAVLYSLARILAKTSVKKM